MVKLWSYDCDNWSVSNKCIHSSSQGCHTVTGTHMPHGITQCYLPPSRGDIPALTPAEAGTWLSNPGGMQGWVDLVGLLHTEMVYPPEDGHPSRYYTRLKTVTHPGTNRTQRALTSFMQRTPLTTTPRRQPLTLLREKTTIKVTIIRH